MGPCKLIEVDFSEPFLELHFKKIVKGFTYTATFFQSYKMVDTHPNQKKKKKTPRTPKACAMLCNKSLCCQISQHWAVFALC